MTVKERIIRITLLEKMENNPDVAKKLGLEGKTRTKEESSNENKINDVK